MSVAGASVLPPCDGSEVSSADAIVLLLLLYPRAGQPRTERLSVVAEVCVGVLYQFARIKVVARVWCVLSMWSSVLRRSLISVLVAWARDEKCVYISPAILLPEMRLPY